MNEQKSATSATVLSTSGTATIELASAAGWVGPEPQNLNFDFGQFRNSPLDLEAPSETSTGTSTRPYYYTPVSQEIDWDKDKPSQAIDWDEVKLKQAAIEATCKALGNKEVTLEEFSMYLEQFYNYLKFGTKITVIN